MYIHKALLHAHSSNKSHACAASTVYLLYMRGAPQTLCNNFGIYYPAPNKHVRTVTYHILCPIYFLYTLILVSYYIYSILMYIYTLCISSSIKSVLLVKYISDKVQGRKKESLHIKINYDMVLILTFRCH